MGSLSPELLSAVIKRLMRGMLVAWDPVEQKERWRINHKTMWNGGVLTTQSRLVFQGTGDGRFVAYQAETGDVLWETPTVTGVIAPPISYEIDGDQYIAIMAGWGGGAALAINLPGSASAGNGRLLVYKLGGSESLPVMALLQRQAVKPPESVATDESIAQGSILYSKHCLRCHGAGAVGNGLVADLRDMNEGTHQLFSEIVLGGIFSELGMVSFKEVLDQQDVDAIHDYVIHASNLRWEEENSPDWWKSTRSWFYNQIAIVIGLIVD